jgi:hypothetical protein
MTDNTGMQNPTRFGLDNRGTKACEHCGVLSWASRQDHESTGLICTGCYDAAGYENEHLDGYHADQAEPLCPTCNPEREARRMAKAAARVAGYTAAAAVKAEKATARNASRPHCPHCGQSRPKTKTWERTGVSSECSDCKDLRDWLKFFTSEVPKAEEAARYQALLERREGKYR